MYKFSRNIDLGFINKKKDNYIKYLLNIIYLYKQIQSVYKCKQSEFSLHF